MTFYVRHFFKRLQIACTKPFTAELVDVSGLWDVLEEEESRKVVLSSGLYLES